MRHLPALLDALLADGVLPDRQRPLHAEAVADALWLAHLIGPVRARGPAAEAEGWLKADAGQDTEPETLERETDTPPEPPPDPPQPAELPAEAPVHVQDGGRTAPGAGPGPAASNLPVGRPSLLDDPLDIGRKLRPLMGRLPSPTRRVLDEAATVQRWAEARVPIPVLRGAPERRWELALVVDAHPAFELWAPLVDDLARLLIRHGAFRDVRLWCLGPDTSEPADAAGAHPVRIWPGPRRSGKGARAPALLRDPRGRRLILIASDFSSPAWRPTPCAAPSPGSPLGQSSGTLAPPANLTVLAAWQRSQPVALLHLLPPTLWPRTALGGTWLGPVTAEPAAHPALPPRLRLAPSARRAPPANAGAPLPVLNLDSAGFGAWARLLAGKPSARLPGAAWLDPPPQPLPAPPPPADARAHLLRFQAGASKPARALARACAGMPLTLPVVRLVQQACRIGGGPAAVAELFLSGLLRRVPDAEQPEPDPAALMVVYDYVHDVRQLLLDAEPPARLNEPLRLVSAAVQRGLGSPRDFPARWIDLDQPIDTATVAEPSQRPFALIRLAVLRRLGGRYAEQIPALVAALAGPEASPKPNLWSDARGASSERELMADAEKRPLPARPVAADHHNPPVTTLNLTFLGYQASGKSTFLTAAQLASRHGRLRSGTTGRAIDLAEILAQGQPSFFTDPIDHRGLSREDLLRLGQILPKTPREEWHTIHLRLGFAGEAPIDCLTFDYAGDLAAVRRMSDAELSLDEHVRACDCLFLFFDGSLPGGQSQDELMMRQHHGQGDAILRACHAFTDSRPGWPIIIVVTKADLLFAGKSVSHVAAEIAYLNGRSPEAIKRGNAKFEEFLRRQGASALAELLLQTRRPAVVRVCFVAALGAMPQRIESPNGDAAFGLSRFEDWTPLGVAETLEVGIREAQRRRRGPIADAVDSFRSRASAWMTPTTGLPDQRQLDGSAERRNGGLGSGARTEGNLVEARWHDTKERSPSHYRAIQSLLDEVDAPSIEPPRRLEIGNLLAAMPSGDPRPGVGLRPDGLPDIAWIEIPGAPVDGLAADGDGDSEELRTFWISRYPITNAQFQAFVDAGGYPPGWPRRGLLTRLFPARPQAASGADWWRGLDQPGPAASKWPQPNRPRTDVDWTEALAFGRWLTAQLGLAAGCIRLPTEAEWEKAARGPRRRAYPWGDEYRAGYANLDETGGKPAGRWNLRQTTAVGLYPHGASAYGVEDLCGTVWEWCMNGVDARKRVSQGHEPAERALRGGSWSNPPHLARADDPGRYLPPGRDETRGFRLLCTCPIDSAA
jgi:formylglycine-generating enzyme required for sulfatase activity